MMIENIFSKKFVGYLLLLILMFSTFVMPASSRDGPSWWDEDWSSREEISVPIETSENAKHQPIDIRIEFDHNCWARNETENSIRVACWDGSKWEEIESQIYDLNFTDENHIKACSLVFLIPEIADGKEKYYVYYDDEEKPAPSYTDHVSIEDSHYYYEPISGLPVDIDYYKIMEDGYCVYGVGQKGSILGELFASQLMAKQKKDKKEFKIQNWDQGAYFASYYFDESGKEISTTESLVSKEIFVDGNLMVEFGIISRSSKEDLQTTSIYKYYYSPSEDKRICAHVKHEALKECRASGDLDGTYANMMTFKTRSGSVEELNIGEILPFIHLYGEDESVREYSIETDPESKEYEWLLSTTDDCDLGKKAWVSMDTGETGKAHSFIFASNENIVKAGVNEKDGIQIKCFEQERIDIPGLEADGANILCGRNSYEMGGSHNKIIPADFVAEFDAEFFTSEEGSYKGVEDEAEVYQSLIKQRPLHGGNVTGVVEKEGERTLTVFTHFSSSIPVLALVGLKVPITSVELYRNGTLISSGMSGRMALKGELPTDLKDLVKSLLKIVRENIDWENITLQTKVRFPKLMPGKYLVKVYRMSRNQTEYVGVKVVEVKENVTTHIWCTLEGKIKLTVSNQNGGGVKGAYGSLLKDGIVIADNTTDENGEMIIKAPCLHPYQFKVFFKEFMMHEEKTRLTPGLILPSQRKNLIFNLYNLELTVKDKLGVPPGVKINPSLTSEEMENSVRISSEGAAPGKYLFTNLPSARYKIQFQYKSFVTEKDHHVPNDGNAIALEFPAEFNAKINVFDSRGSLLKDAHVLITRKGKEFDDFTDEKGKTSFLLPPGGYAIKVYSNNKLIGEKKVEITGDKTTDVVTTKNPIFPLIVIGVAISIMIITALFTLFKKIHVGTFIKSIAILLAIMAIILPWWGLSGSATHSSIETSTKAFLIPPTMVTMTSSSTATDAELAVVPELFTQVMGLIPVLIAIGCLLIFMSMPLKKLNKKKISNLLLFLAVALMITGIAIFSFGMSELAKAGLGSFQGKENLSISIPGTMDYTTVPCSWGPSIGFYLCIVSIVAVLTVGILDILRKVPS